MLNLALALSLVQNPNGFTGMSMAAFLHNNGTFQHMSDDQRGGDAQVQVQVCMLWQD